MAHQVRMTAQAERDVENVLKWFRDESLDAAATRWLSQFMLRIHTLEEHPQRCPLAIEAGELGLELRETLLGKRNKKYRILFTIDGSTVHILRVWHGARRSVTGEDL